MVAVNNSNIPDCLTVPELKRQHNQQMFSRIASKYDLLNKILSFDRDLKWKKSAVAMLPDTGVQKCLDIACGTSTVTALLAQKYPDAKITALDLNADMLELAKKRAGCEKVEFVLGDMCSLPFEDNSFDIVTAVYAIRNAPDLQKSLDETIRVTKPGGYICIFDFSKPANKFLQFIEFVLLNIWCSFWSLLFYRRRIYSYIVSSLRAFPDSKELKNILTGCGFKIENTATQAFGMIKIIICRKCC